MSSKPTKATDTQGAGPPARKKKKTPKVQHLEVKPSEKQDPVVSRRASEDISQEISDAEPPSIQDPFKMDYAEGQTNAALPRDETDSSTPFIVTELPSYPENVEPAELPAPPRRKRFRWKPRFSRNGSTATDEAEADTGGMCKAIVFVRYPYRNWYFTKIAEKDLHAKGITPVKDSRGGWIYPVVIGSNGVWSTWPRVNVPVMASSHALYRATHWPQHRVIASQANQNWQKAIGIGILVVVALLLGLTFLLIFFFFL